MRCDGCASSKPCRPISRPKRRGRRPTLSRPGRCHASSRPDPPQRRGLRSEAPSVIVAAMRKLVQNYRVVTALMAAIILYGSLYPFQFRIPADGIGPVATLLGSWATLSTRGDILSNILLYMPLGFFAVLAGDAERSGGARLLRALLLGAALCIAIELVQYYDEGRETSASDVYSNVLGTLLGGIGGLVIGGDLRWPLVRECAAAPVPTLLLVGYLGYRLFPYVPTIDLHKYWDALKPIVLTPSLAPY